MHAEKILILDFGSQYTQLIARRVREIGVYCEIYPCTVDEKFIREFSAKGVILSGGPETVCADDTPRAPDIIFNLGCPVLGICYGMQTMALQLGGKVKPVGHREFGAAKIEVINENKLFKEIADELTTDGKTLLNVWMSHGDQVVELPKDFITLASTDNCTIAAMADVNKNLYGVQFHPEVTHSVQGLRMLQHFVFDICGCSANWTIKNIIDETIQTIREQVKNEKIILALSGGVDSSVAAQLLHRAIGDQLICVFVDTGFLRLNEADHVMQLFAEHLKINVIKVDAKERFFTALEGIVDPEDKRKTAGRLFIEIFEEQANQLQNINWLAQGTIYSDVIESAQAGKSSHVIKSHHNVGGLPENMRLKLIEPLRELFKDEVRKVGLELGLSHELLYRHPFPGPGLVVRMLGEIIPEHVVTLQKADDIFIQELRDANLYDKVSQAFAVFLPVKSVAVMGDARHYGYVIALRAVETIDFMTARWAELPHQFLAKVAQRICNEVHNVSRVVYDVTDKPPATIEWE